MKDNSTLQEKFNPPHLELPEDLTDEELFARAMAEVKPLNGVIPRSPRRGTRSRTPRLPSREQEYQILMSEVRENDWLSHPGYIEGGPELRNPVLLEKLRRGDFSVQAELDLHGFFQKEALERVEAFILYCRKRQFTCVRIIHGKGNNSRDRVPVLKNQIQRWLSLKRLSRYVVAYTSARPVDGGSGAIYLLLRPE